ncbi:MAG: hypothetical protein ACLT9K_05125 [Clostridium sp.]|uniref:hypothetical protein n=1 Tax=Clostridium sp. OM05-6BH TaxID=2293044 RepID=UPI0015FD725D|nr:hypothetical protein [Clostridium sp. OM05-6BH]
MKKLKLTNCKKLRRLDLTPFDMKSLDIKGTTRRISSCCSLFGYLRIIISNVFIIIAG